MARDTKGTRFPYTVTFIANAGRGRFEANQTQPGNGVRTRYPEALRRAAAMEPLQHGCAFSRCDGGSVVGHFDEAPYSAAQREAQGATLLHELDRVVGQVAGRLEKQRAVTVDFARRCKAHRPAQIAASGEWRIEISELLRQCIQSTVTKLPRQAVEKYPREFSRLRPTSIPVPTVASPRESK